MGRGFAAPAVTSRVPVKVHGRHIVVRGIIHATEGPNKPGPQEPKNVALFWQGQGQGYGTPLVIDAEGNTNKGCLTVELTWHTGGRNTGSFGIENVGFSSETSVQWATHKAGLKQLAKWMAWCKREHGVPLTWDVQRGWSTHAMQSAAFHTTDHTDPGPNFPKKRVMAWARWYAINGWHTAPSA